MTKNKRVGWFRPPKIQKQEDTSKYVKALDILKFEDQKMPMLTRDLDRIKIFNILNEHCSEAICIKLNIPLGSYKSNVQIIDILRWLTSIVAYQLSQRKIKGLGATTNNKEGIEVNDKVLVGLKKSLDVLFDIKTNHITENHIRFLPEIENDIDDLIDMTLQSYDQYLENCSREKILIIKCEMAFVCLCAAFSEHEIREIVRQAIKYFNEKKYKVQVKSINRLLTKKSYYEDCFNKFKDEKELYLRMREYSRKQKKTQKN